MSSAAEQAAPAMEGCSPCILRSSASAKAHERFWPAISVRQRLQVLRRARQRMAAQAEAFAAAISPELPRNHADTLVTELLPLLDACRFLERNAERLLQPRRLGRTGRPFWLGGVQAETHREPLGHVLVIGPANFPLFLPGVQVLQALAAGNRVTWKPGAGGAPVALLVAAALHAAGLPAGQLHVTDGSVEAAQTALAAKPDKVIFTGSAGAGRSVLRGLAETATPAVVELSGADAVVVLPDADIPVVARAIAFGLRLNGGQVCMSPRRLFAAEETLQRLRPALSRELQYVPPVPLNARTAAALRDLSAAAAQSGAALIGEITPAAQRPLLIDNAAPSMAITRTDLFAPVLSLIALRSMMELPEAYAACPYSLTASIFCGRSHAKQAHALARLLPAGTVLINDLIAPTADPRVSFSGRGASGYGATRGAEGLLEMTAVKTLLVRSGGAMRHLEPTTDDDAPLFAGLIRAAHAGTWRDRWHGMRTVITSSRTRKPSRSKDA